MTKNLQWGIDSVLKTAFSTVLKRKSKSMTTPMRDKKISIIIAMLIMLASVF